jgi:polyribonucleotide nucleotidyltransferase
LKIGEEDLILETGKIARQANGAVFGSYGGSAVLATACCSSQDLENLEFIPLQVEYNEKYYAAGKIPGGFIKREGRPKDKEILVSRQIDRPIRPLFSKKFKREIQVIPTVISTDQVNPPDVVAMVSASAALTISDIPFEGPVGAVRIGYLDGTFTVNPTYDQIEKSDLNIVVAGTMDGITMVEGGAAEVSEEVMVEAIEEAHKWIKELCRIQLELREAAGRTKFDLAQIEEEELDPSVKEELLAWVKPEMEEACFVPGKMARSAAIKAVRDRAVKSVSEKIPEQQVRLVKDLLEDLEYSTVRRSILDRKIRTDGRGPADIREISCEVDVLAPPTVQPCSRGVKPRPWPLPRWVRCSTSRCWTI